jgi:hypothetical protein
MKDLVKQQHLKTLDALVPAILDPAIAMKYNPNLAIHRRTKLYTEAEGGYTEQLL